MKEHNEEIEQARGASEAKQERAKRRGETAQQQLRKAQQVTRRRFSAEDKIGIVMEGMRGGRAGVGAVSAAGLADDGVLSVAERLPRSRQAAAARRRLRKQYGGASSYCQPQLNWQSYGWVTCGWQKNAIACAVSDEALRPKQIRQEIKKRYRPGTQGAGAEPIGISRQNLNDVLQQAVAKGIVMRDKQPRRSKQTTDKVSAEQTR